MKKKRARVRRRRVTRRRTTRPMQRRGGASAILALVAKAFTPKPYDENEAAVDALSGREACRHGQWPHQRALCGLCTAEEATKFCLKLLAAEP